MRNILLPVLSAWLLSSNTQAQQPAALPDVKPGYAWQQIEVTRINKEEPRAFFFSYSDFEKATRPLRTEDFFHVYEQGNYRLLNGDWRFFFAQEPKQVNEDFFTPDFDDSRWDIIDVPCSWQARGYDRIFYDNIPGEFQFDLQGNWLPGYEDSWNKHPEATLNPRIPELHRQSGIYRRSFLTPAEWSGHQVFIRFNGVRTGFNLYVNGRFVGYSVDSFTPAEFNITEYLKSKGENSLAVEVFKYSTGAYFEMQDMPHMAGIIRDVMLISRPQTYIRDYFAPGRLSDDCKTAEINFSAEVANNARNKAKGYKLEAFIIDDKGEYLSPAGKAFFSQTLEAIPAKGKQTVESQITLNGFKLWTPDKPNLYAILIKLSDHKGKVLETIRADYGFRRFDTKGKDMLLNGKSVLIKGVNRHDWSPDKGKACSLDWMLKDITLMKQANIEFVRTSHYPNDDLWYMLCSRYGIALIDECNQEQHGFIKSSPLDLDSFITPSLDRMRNMVIRDRNIPSVLIFSLGNESSHRLTRGHEEMAKLTRELAPLHKVHSEPESKVVKDGRNAGWSDFVSPMYGGVDRMNKYLNLPNETRPFFFCEYSHAMGNAIGSLNENWNLIRSNPHVLHGGFIWDWVDQGLYLPREDGKGVYISDGRDWKTKPSSYNFCHNGIVFADRSYSAKYQEVRHVYQPIQISAPENAPIGQITITNEYLATNLNELDGSIIVERDGKCIAQTILPRLSLAARETGTFNVKLPDYDPTIPGEYFYRIRFSIPEATLALPAGYIISETQIPLPMRPHTETISMQGEINVTESTESIILQSGASKLTFDRSKAELANYQVNGQPMFITPLRLDIYGVSIDNGGAYRNAYYGNSLDRMKEAKPQLLMEKLSENCIRVICRKTLHTEDGMGFATEFAYTFLSGGTFQVSASAQKINYTPSDLALARVGVAMSIPETYSEVEYYGHGPFANYNDRITAAHVGRYTSHVQEWFEPFSRVQDTGNREGVRWLALRDETGTGAVFSAIEHPQPFAVLPYTQEVMSKAKHPYLLPEHSDNELRIAWKVRGVGNAACGPDTRKAFRADFSGKVSWAFTVTPLLPGMDAGCKGKLKFPESYSFMPQADSLNLVDNEVMPQLKGNWISKDATVSYSSISKQYSPKVDDLLTTGKGIYAFHTDREDNPWLIVDLGSERTVNGAEIWNRQGSGSGKANNLWLSISTDGKNWTDVWHTKSAKIRWAAIIDQPQKARYVRLQLRKPREEFHLKLVKIFGE